MLDIILNKHYHTYLHFVDNILIRISNYTLGWFKLFVSFNKTSWTWASYWPLA